MLGISYSTTSFSSQKAHQDNTQTCNTSEVNANGQGYRIGSTSNIIFIRGLTSGLYISYLYYIASDYSSG